MALVSVTLCVERINFMFQRCNQGPAKSSFYLALNKCSENRANFLVSGPDRIYIGRANGTRLTTVAAADAIVGAVAAIAAFAGAAPGANAGTQGIGRADRKSTRLNSSPLVTSSPVFFFKQKN